MVGWVVMTSYIAAFVCELCKQPMRKPFIKQLSKIAIGYIQLAVERYSGVVCPQ